MTSSWPELVRVLVSPEILILFAMVFVGLAALPNAPRRKAETAVGPIGTRLAAGDPRRDTIQAGAALAANLPVPDRHEILLSDIQKSDLVQLGSQLEQILKALNQIAQSLQASTLFGSVDIGRYIQNISSRMDEVRSLLREISNKLDRR